MIRILEGDVCERLRDLADESVQMVVTSPPYYALRDYGVPGQIGLEGSLSEYLDKLVDVFRDVRRVLRTDGLCWVNIGDSYTSGGSTTRDPGKSRLHPAYTNGGGIVTTWRPSDPPGLKPKELMGVPWRLALALQADGWYWRDAICWAKDNPMPESVRDRCTKSWEPILMFSKAERYYWNFQAMQEPVNGGAHARRSYKTPDGWDTRTGHGGHGSFHKNWREKGHLAYQPKRDIGVGPKARPAKGCPNEPRVKYNASFSAAVVDLVTTRNMRNVWRFPTEAFSDGEHYATFPTELPRRTILAGSRPGDTVLDPFAGAGTTLLVADRLQREAIGIELNADYCEMMRARLTRDAPLFVEIGA